MATLDRRTCARCGERDGEIFALKDMNQGENAPPLHPRCRCTIVATFDTPKSRSKPVGERSARETGNRRERAPADMTYRDWKAIYIDKSKTFADWRSAKDASDKIQSGALNPASVRAEEHAFRYYESARHMKTDCQRISKNTGFREEDIQRIKNHIFYAEHELYDGEKGRFYPSYHMSQSWQRLIDGRNIQSRDIILLNHEFLESVIESEGFNVQRAHMVAEAIYNYSALIK